MTYAELDAASTSVAELLGQLGLREEEAVGITLPRSPAWLVAALGILKAGGCYVPLDLSFPEERRAFLALDVRIRIATSDEATGAMPAFRRIAGAEEDRLPQAAPSDTEARLAYIIYTSGSTGEPKGVEVTQAGVLRLVHGQESIDYSEQEVFAHFLTPTFDASTFEILGAHLHGGRWRSLRRRSSRSRNLVNSSSDTG